MNQRLPKKSAKELFIVGIASASVFISGSALALVKTNNINSNQSFNKPTSQANSTVRSQEVLAQTAPEDNTPPPTDVRPRENPPPATGGGSSGGGQASPSDGGSGSGSGSGGATGAPQPPDAKPRGSIPPTTGTSPTDSPSSSVVNGPKPGTWLCINNPNPSCRG